MKSIPTGGLPMTQFQLQLQEFKMTYPKTLSRYQALTIAPVLKNLENLAEGKSLCLSVNAPSRLKYLLYAHWQIQNLKDLFKIYQNGNNLTIHRVRPLEIFKLEENKMSPAEEYMIENALLTMDSQSEVESHLEATDLNPQTKYSIIECWLQNQGL